MKTEKMVLRETPQFVSPPHTTGALSHEKQPAEEAERDSGVTFRVVVFSLLLACFFGWVLPIVDMRFFNTYLGAQALPMGGLAVLLTLLLVLQPLLRVLSKIFGERALLSRNETLTIYITCLFSCLVPGHGAEHYFVPNSVGAFYFATPENKWLDYLAHLKSWLSPALQGDGGTYGEAGRKVAAGWYEGSKGVVPWEAWLVPIAAWSALILATYFLWACLAVLLRAQWGEREALAFPLLRLPLAMTENEDDTKPRVLGGGFFRSPLMWLGFGIAVFIQGLNGLHLYFPDVPQIPLSLDANQFLTESPWNQLDTFFILVYPVVIGITYLLTAEISFSLWFFFLFFKLQLLVAYYSGYLPSTLPSAVGWAGPAPRTFASFQQLGAYVVYFAALLWAAREHLKHVGKRAFGRTPSTQAERNEAMSYPLAFWGAIFSFAFIIAWSVAAGMGFALALATWSFYLICVVALTRIVAESGMLYVQQGFTPLGTFAQLTGAGPGTWLTAQTLVPASMAQMTAIIDLRANLMPSFLQSFKLAKDRGMRVRPLLWLIGAVILVSYALGVYQSIALGYEYSGLGFQGWYAEWSPRWAADVPKQLTSDVPGYSWTNWLWMLLGGAMTVGMMIARSRLAWFPLHPIGLLMGLTSPMYTFGFSVFLGWLCKVVVTKMGGTESYRKLVPLFLGLALGDVAMMVLWIVIDGWQGRTGHQLLPG